MTNIEMYELQAELGLSLLAIVHDNYGRAWDALSRLLREGYSEFGYRKVEEIKALKDFIWDQFSKLALQMTDLQVFLNPDIYGED